MKWQIACSLGFVCLIALSSQAYGNGVKRVHYDGSSAVIEVDNYWFNDGTELSVKELCGEILQAARTTNVQNIYLKVKVQGADKYGNEVTRIHYDTIASGRADLDEIARYQTRDAFFDDLGKGVMMKYQQIVLRDDNIIN